jgi:hypothetical protein
LSLVSNKSKKVFLCKDTIIDTQDKVDIIISPELYWVRIFDIPVKSITQARHVLPTLFEDILENVRELSYQVQKLPDDKFLCFAYENKKVFDAIKNSGVNLSLVNSVYFAQNECKEIPQFKCENKAFSYTKDGVLVKIPSALLSEDKDINEEIQNITLSSNRVDIKLYNNLLNTKQIYMIIAASLIFTFINIFKISDYNTEISKIEDKIETLKTSNKMPSSMLQLNSIVNTYKKDAKLEIKKRELIDYIFKNKEFNLLNLSLEKNVLEVNLIDSNKAKVDDYISKKYKVLSSKTKGLNLTVRIEL